MKLNKEDLVALLQSEIKTVTTGTEFEERMKSVLAGMVEDLKKSIQQPFSQGNFKDLQSQMPFAKVDGDIFTTSKGSMINLKNKQAPWMCLSNEMKDWAKEFVDYVKGKGIGKLLSGSSDSDGGYTIPEEFRAIMIMYDAEDTLVWQRATVWPMSGAKMSFPRLIQNMDVEDAAFDPFSGVTFGWIDEGAEKPETQPEFGLLELIAHELAGYSEITNSLLDDSFINIMNYLTRIFRSGWYWITDKSFISGVGGKSPLGILNAPGVLTVSRAVASNVNVEDILGMDSRLPTAFDNGSVWFLSKKARANLRGQKTTGGELILQEFFNSALGSYSAVMLNRPVVLADGKIPALGTRGDVILGNWAQYYIGFRQDFMMDSSTHYQFRKNRTAVRCSGRVDGIPANDQAFVVLGDHV